MKAWGREAYAPDGPGHGSRLDEIESVTLADYPRIYAEFIEELSVFTIIDGAAITLFDGLWSLIGASRGGVSRGRRRVKPLRGSSASLRPFG